MLADVALRALVWTRTFPLLVPAATMLELPGATVIAEIDELSDMAALAWVQPEAPLMVRHSEDPPIHSLVELFESMVNGTMNMKPLSPLMPLVAPDQLVPPLMDF